MPVCRDCGNKNIFSSSKISSETPFANPPLPLKANFTSDGSLGTLEYTGSDNSTLDGAWENPQAFFDVCGICGSDRIEW